MVEYFGYQNGNTNQDPIIATVYNTSSYVVGTVGKNYNVVELAMGAKSKGGTQAHVRTALYDNSKNLVCQGDAEILVNSTTNTWWTHTSFIGTTEIVGGNSFYIVCTRDGSDVYPWLLGSGSLQYINPTEYTGGFPATIAGGENYPRTYNIRVGVTEVASSTSIPVLLAALGEYCLLGGFLGLYEILKRMIQRHSMIMRPSGLLVPRMVGE
jgi:hypothetical protein